MKNKTSNKTELEAINLEIKREQLKNLKSNNSIKKAAQVIVAAPIWYFGACFLYLIVQFFVTDPMNYWTKGKTYDCAHPTAIATCPEIVVK